MAEKTAVLGINLGKLSTRERRLFLLAVVSILAGILHAVVIVPILKLKNKPEEGVILLEKKLNEYNRIIREAGVVVGGQPVVPALDIEKQIYAVAAERDSAITLNQVYPQRSSPEESHKLSYSVTAEGRLDRMLNFMQKMEKMPYLVFIEQFTLSSPGGDENLRAASPVSCAMVISYQPLSCVQVSARPMSIKEDGQPQPEKKITLPPAPADNDLSLQGILKKGESCEAIILDKKSGAILYVKKGETLSGKEVSDIQWDRIILQDDQGDKIELVVGK